MLWMKRWFLGLAVATACGSEASASTPAFPTTLERLRFAIAGDTRPAVIDDTAAYPAEVIGGIWAEIEARRPAFAVTTGDYIFARPSGAEAEKQLDLYLRARARYTGPVLFAMGNHECSGATASNCLDPASVANYGAFMRRMIAPLGFSTPYYSATIRGARAEWTAKLIFIAANAWSEDQSKWLDDQLSKATTYTFVIRHESKTATDAPGTKPSNAILERHPYTLLIAGHKHTFAYAPKLHQLIVGNGGAPLSGGSRFGYALIERNADGTIQIEGYDLGAAAPFERHTIAADGRPIP
jgi:hypothetical protein